MPKVKYYLHYSLISLVKKNVVDHVFQDVVTRASSIPIATTYNATPHSDYVEQPSVSSSRSAKRELSTHHFDYFMFYV